MGEDVADPDRERATEPDFERELRDLVLTAFAEGAAVSGDWTVSTVPDGIPDWRVRIERQDRKTAASRDGDAATNPDEAVGGSS